MEAVLVLGSVGGDLVVVVEAVLVLVDAVVVTLSYE